VAEPHDHMLTGLTISMPAGDFRWWPELRQQIGDAVSARILASWKNVTSPPQEVSICWYRVRREHLSSVAELIRPEEFAAHPHVEPVTSDMSFARNDVVLCQGYPSGWWH
jgi:hypothetical protein